MTTLSSSLTSNSSPVPPIFSTRRLFGFEGNQISAVDGVAEEDSGVELGDDASATRLGDGEGCVFATGAAAEIFAADDDLEIAFEFVGADEGDVAVREAGLAFGDAAHGVHAEEFAFLGHGGVIGKIFGGDDLVGVEIVAQNVRLAADDGFHFVFSPMSLSW